MHTKKSGCGKIDLEISIFLCIETQKRNNRHQMLNMELKGYENLKSLLANVENDMVMGTSLIIRNENDLD